VTLKVISRSNIDIILKIQHFEGRFQPAGSMTFKVTLKVTGVKNTVPAAGVRLSNLPFWTF
jgi:hypothetical protein